MDVAPLLTERFGRSGRRPGGLARRPFSARLCRVAPALFLSISCVSTALAGDVPTYQERLEYDPATGEWKEVAAPIPGTEAGDLALGRQFLAHGDYKEARKLFKEWFKTYPDSTLRPEALFYSAETEILAADAATRSGDLIQAYDWLEDLLDGWPGGELADRALRKELIIAELLLNKGRKQKIWKGVLWLSGEEEAVMMLDRIIDERAPGTPIAEQALRLKADYYYQHGDFEDAENAYARLMREYPRGKYSKLSLLRAGEAALARFPGVEFDEADLLEAEVYLQDFQQKYPGEAGEYGIPQILAGIDERQAEKEYRVGRYYERIKQIDAAAYYYRYIVDHFAGTTWAAEAQNRLIALGAVPPDEPTPMMEEPAPLDESNQNEAPPAVGMAEPR